MLLFKPKDRWGHPEIKYSCYLKKCFLDQSIQKKVLFHFENRSTGGRSKVVVLRPHFLNDCLIVDVAWQGHQYISQEYTFHYFVPIEKPGSSNCGANINGITFYNFVQENSHNTVCSPSFLLLLVQRLRASEWFIRHLLCMLCTCSNAMIYRSQSSYRVRVWLIRLSYGQSDLPAKFLRFQTHLTSVLSSGPNAIATLNNRNWNCFDAFWTSGSSIV